MLSQKVRAFVEERLTAKLEPIDKALAKATVSPEQRDQLTLEREALCEKFRPATWLSDAAQRAKQIKLVTHAPKFSHSDSKSMGALVTEPEQTSLLTTASLPQRELDVIGNAAALDVAGLLKLADDTGTLLADQLQGGDASALAEFSRTEVELAEWLAGFSRAFATPSPQSHTLAKQLYFPVAENYHLLSPLYASSLAHGVTDKIRYHLYGEQAQQARKAQKQAEPCDFPLIRYLNLAVVEYGGSKPQNISKLNAERGGRGYLLSCQPPNWHTQIKAPQTSRQFWQQLERASWFDLKALKQYLEKYKDKPSTEPIRSQRAKMVDGIVDQFLQLVAQLRLLPEQTNIARDWSTDTELTAAEALLLNPQRTELDAEFKQLRERKDWPDDIGKQFGQWLNNQLQTDTLNFGDVESGHWARQLRNTLAQLRDDLSYLQGGV